MVGGPNDNSPLISKDRRFSGSGSDTDIVTSSARAYTAALNKLLSWSMRRQTQNNPDREEVSDAVAMPPPAATVVGSS